MSTSQAGPKPSSRNRLSLILQLALPAAAKSEASFNGSGAVHRRPQTVSSTASTGSITPDIYHPLPSPPDPPRSPVLTTSAQINSAVTPQSDLVPSTYNELDATEKAKLLKKARKLSTIFGEALAIVPHMEQDENSAVSLPAKDSRKAEQTKRRKSLQVKLAGGLDITESLSSYWKRTPSSPTGDGRSSSAGAASCSSSARAAKDASNKSALSGTPTSIPSSPDKWRKPSLAKFSTLSEGSSPQFIYRPLADECAPPTHTRRRLRKDRRRRSLEIFSLSQPSSPTSSRPDIIGKDSVDNLKRSRSLWTGRSRYADDVLQATKDDFQLRYHDFGADEDIDGVQKHLAVKRARKMTQIFGEEPPVELIQTQDDNLRLLTMKDSTTDSVSTFLSFSSTYLLPTPPSPRHTRVDSISSLASATDPSLDMDVDVDLLPEESTPRHSVDTRHSRSSDDPLPSPVPSDDATAVFRDRRRRAAKLSRFFGVGFQDIQEVSQQTEMSTPTQVDAAKPITSVEVDVQVTNRRFWGLVDSRPHLKDAEMADVIGKLRDLRAG